jgi:hypothetical protein
LGFLIWDLFRTSIFGHSSARCPRAGAGDLPKRNIGRFTPQAVATEGNEGNEGSREHRRASRAAPVHTISFVAFVSFCRRNLSVRLPPYSRLHGSCGNHHRIQSGRGLPHSKTCGHSGGSGATLRVLECGRPRPLWYFQHERTEGTACCEDPGWIIGYLRGGNVKGHRAASYVLAFWKCCVHFSQHDDASS